MRSTDFPDLEAMRHGTDLKYPITCRGKTYMVRPLTCLEVIQAAAKTAEDFLKLPQGQQLDATSGLLNAMNQLERASSEDVGMPGTITLALLERMTPDEINHLWKQYVRVTDRVNPDLESVSAGELSTMVEGLKKNSDQASLLIDLSISQLIAVCLRLLSATGG